MAFNLHRSSGRPLMVFDVNRSAMDQVGAICLAFSILLAFMTILREVFLESMFSVRCELIYRLLHFSSNLIFTRLPWAWCITFPFKLFFRRDLGVL